MRKISFQLSVVLIICLMSCINVENYMKEEIVFIQYNIENHNCDTSDFKLYHGKIEMIDQCLYKVIFYSARGGETILFGKVIKDQKPQTQNIISIYNDSVLIDQLSYFDILKLKSMNLDSLKVFLYP